MPTRYSCVLISFGTPIRITHLPEINMASADRLAPGRPAGGAPSPPEATLSEAAERFVLVPAPVHQTVLGDPGHHRAQLLADLLDRMLTHLPAHRLEARLVDLVLEHPLAREAAGLDIRQHFLHRLAHAGIDNPRTGDIFTVLGGVGDGIIHVGDAALIDEVDDQ